MTFLLSFLALFLLLWVSFLFAGPRLEGLLGRGAHFAAKFRYRDYVPVFVILAAGIAVTTLAGDAFVDIAERVHANSQDVREIDSRAHAWASSHRTAGSTSFFVTMTHVGDPLSLAILVALAAGALVLRGRWRWAVWLVLTTAVGGLLNLELKVFFARARPELAEALRQAHGYSFPSGHAMGSTLVFGALGYLGFRSIRNWRPRAAALALCCSLIVAIALSRVYLGVHWISDVGAGVAAGLIWVISSMLAYETFRRIRLVRALRARREPPASG